VCNVNISQNKCETLVQNLLKERFQLVRCMEMPEAPLEVGVPMELDDEGLFSCECQYLC
jgi:hypothetical protein